MYFEAFFDNRIRERQGDMGNPDAARAVQIAERQADTSARTRRVVRAQVVKKGCSQSQLEMPAPPSQNAKAVSALT
jgi:hypothetical protein